MSGIRPLQLSVPDSEDLDAFLSSARKIWRQAHPYRGKQNKGGRPSKKEIVWAACQKGWNFYKRRRPTLGSLIRKISGILRAEGHKVSIKTIQRHLPQWMRVNLTLTELPTGVLQRNPGIRKIALQYLSVMTLLHQNLDKILLALKHLAADPSLQGTQGGILLPQNQHKLRQALNRLASDPSFFIHHSKTPKN